MGKKGRWFSALRRAFTSTSKDRPGGEQLQNNDVTSLERKYVKEKKRWGIGRSRDAEPNSFIPLRREPSSIEKILGDVEREQQHWIHQAPPKRGILHGKELIPPNIEVIPKHESLLKQEKAPKKELLSKNGQPADHRNPVQNREFPHIKDGLLPKRDLNFKTEETAKKEEALPKTIRRRPPVTLKDAQIPATMIQAAYRGYKARKSYRSLKGLIRLQTLMRGESVKHQTMNAMRCMQLLVRVQSQIRSRRMQRIENRNHRHNQAFSKTKMENENNIGGWYLATRSEREDEHWEDSVLTKEEVDKRMQRKVDAITKRERALAYAYSNQLLKVTPKTASAMLTDIRSGGYPMWWSWLERTVGPKETTNTASVPDTSSKPTTTISSNTSRHNKSQPFDSSTPRTSFSKPGFHPRISSNRWSAQPSARDDESLTSCPPFTAVPRYMVPTVSARAKVREATPPPGSVDVRRRFSVALGQSLGSLRWTGSRPKTSDKRTKHRPTGSVETMSVDSTLSLPVGFAGRRPFK